MVGRKALGVSVISILILSGCGEEPQPAFETPPPSTAPTTTTTTTVAATPTTAATTTTVPPSTAPPTTAISFCDTVDTPTEPLITAQVGDIDGDELPDGIALFDNGDGTGLLLVSSTTQGPIGMEIPSFTPGIYTKPSIAGADIDKDGDMELFFPIRREGPTRFDQILEPADCAMQPVAMGDSPFELQFENSGKRKALIRCGNGTVVTVIGPANGQQSKATVYQVKEGSAEKRYEFQTDANASEAPGVGQRCSGVANQGPGPQPPG